MNEIKLMSDEELMKEYQKGNMKAFEEIYHRFSGQVYGYLRMKIRDQQSADDIFQTTFMRLHHFRSSYDSKFVFKAWLFTICKNCVMDHFRKLKRIDHSLKGEFENQLREELQGELQKEIYEESDLSQEMEKLPENQRLAIEYRYFKDYSFEEIAQKLQTSPLNARQILSRAVKKLRVFMNISKKGMTL